MIFLSLANNLRENHGHYGSKGDENHQAKEAGAAFVSLNVFFKIRAAFDATGIYCDPSSTIVVRDINICPLVESTVSFATTSTLTCPEAEVLIGAKIVSYFVTTFNMAFQFGVA